ncbi:heme NO-binding domain-containing protein [uncultured Roseobacter sp.]|uniref:heme NO-binding domain-containing protein n=1 Tax=uncultured Roseobacter sp. TaxID=114847 RepID=UPI002606C04E|nr:heme NO-binding domain-containing protein [uncultured Roseobacter sp.]
MHGLVNRAIQRFVTDCYGEAQWRAAIKRADVGVTEFEAMLTYEEELTTQVLTAVSDVLDRPYEELMEDIGTYLVSHPNVEALRRLLRFSGVDFTDFLHSLDDLPDRARLAVSDLELPRITLKEQGTGYYRLSVQSRIPGAGHLFTGVLRAMADDYGALVFLEHQGSENGAEIVGVSLLETEFSEGRGFHLGARAG